ncbi:MAG TPA: M55 family metallopeptidase [Candidatus Dormibacteraeota bacterium]|nr:M55 family metallopeptidase [Candidatus Dormibacteraeota bacterium]
MRVLVSVDMEGIAGVAVAADVSPGTVEYERNRQLMTAEASAAVRGALAFAPDVEVVVADAHGPFCNLLAADLDPRATLVRGRPRPGGMVTDIATVDAAIFIGYHGRAGTPTSVLSHTIHGCIADVRCNGRSLGEIGLNAALGAFHGVPTVLVSGDDTVAAEASEVIPGVVTVAVKRALGSRATESLHPAQACRRIEAAVPAALAARPAAPAPLLAGPVIVEVDLRYEGMAEPPLLVPGMERSGPRTVRYAAPDFPTAFDVVRLIAVLSAAAG